MKGGVPHPPRPIAAPFLKFRKMGLHSVWGEWVISSSVGLRRFIFDGYFIEFYLEAFLEIHNKIEDFEGWVGRGHSR